MFSKTIGKTIAVLHAVLTVVLGSAALLGQQTLSQQTPAPPSSTAGLELPVIMRQNVAAGATPVGTKVQAKLAVATLVDGVVVPRDAILSGEVTESVAKSATGASRLAIRMDSAQWKKGSSPIVLSLAPKVYLTAWYYPVATMTAQDVLYQPADGAHGAKNSNGMGTYPDRKNPASQQPFPGSDADRDSSAAPASPASSISTHRVLMKNVESTRNGDGAVSLTSKNSNIKIDKTTTYVLATGDLLPTH
jgi:hypothetical protein